MDMGNLSSGRPHPALARVRRAVREFFDDPAHADYLEAEELFVAVSGGADSLALAEACAYFFRHKSTRVHALIVDHGLQPGSAEVAAKAAAMACRLGADNATVLSVEVNASGGPEAAARKARYQALSAALPTLNSLVLLGHTRDDQAETVLLGMGRGSGPRSISGMRPLNPPWARPLLTVSRSDTHEACAALGIEPWQDPHNVESRFTRVRLRTEVLPLLEDVLSGGVAAALARTAAQLREDAEVLDLLAEELRVEAGTTELDTHVLLSRPAALRRRAVRRWLLDQGVRELSDAQLRSVEMLIVAWRGQGGVWLPGGLVVERAHGRLRVSGPSKPN